MRRYLGLLIASVVCLSPFLSTIPAFGQSYPGWAENESYTTSCAEEDNINVPLFSPGIGRFWVVVRHPTYCPCVYSCAPDFTGCPSGGGSGTETVTNIHDDGNWVIEVCDLSDWWRPYQITATVDGASASGSYLRIAKKIPGLASWPQVLVLYEDGNLRIKPHPPEGVEDVCFGSSVVVGPAVPAMRPYVDIQSVEIHPETSVIGLDFLYRNGETAHVSFRVDSTEAVATVEVGYITSASLPFVTFRSMWVADGNADVDHIASGGSSYTIRSGWTTLSGAAWFFYRHVESTHNKSAPDIDIVADTNAAFLVRSQTGDVLADSGFYGSGFHAGSADVAELVTVSEQVEPGDVLQLDPQNPGHYRRARASSPALLAGVVSTSPGFLLGTDPHASAVGRCALDVGLASGDSDSRPASPDLGLASASSTLSLPPTTSRQALLALVGMVPVKATDEGGPIRVGDLLVVSSTPGCAMRWDPASEGDRAGLVGKALEALEEGQGVIRVLLSAH